MKTDALIQPVYSTDKANRSIPLGCSHLTISCDGHTFACSGKAILRLQPRLRLVLNADISGQPEAVFRLAMARGPVTVQYGSRARASKVLVMNSTWSAGPTVPTGSAEFIPNPERLTICGDRRRRLSYLTFHVMNFPAFLSQGETVTDLRYKSPSGQLQRLGRAVLEHAGWRIELQTLPNTDELIKQLQAEGGYAITHVGRLERTNGRTFWISQAESALKDLHRFLSFARGLWVPIVLPVGMDRKGNRVFEEWGGHLATAWEPRLSWFDEHNGQSLSELYPGFMDVLQDPDLGASVKAALYWYLRSNRAGEGAGVDSGVILSQAALERLAAAYLTNAGLLTRGNAADRFRRAFRHMRLPTAIPKEMSVISTTRRKGVWTDLPDALVKVRNELTHSKPQLTVGVRRVVADIWNIAQWYIELCILRLSGYRGMYLNRLHRRRRRQVEQMPWAVRRSRVSRSGDNGSSDPRTRVQRG